jgi:hypothetical protein
MFKISHPLLQTPFYIIINSWINSRFFSVEFYPNPYNKKIQASFPLSTTSLYWQMTWSRINSSTSEPALKFWLALQIMEYFFLQISQLSKQEQKYFQIWLPNLSIKFIERRESNALKKAIVSSRLNSKDRRHGLFIFLRTKIFCWLFRDYNFLYLHQKLTKLRD